MIAVKKICSVDIFNLCAIECLERIGLYEPTEQQIHTVEKFLQRIAGHETKIICRLMQLLNLKLLID